MTAAPQIEPSRISAIKIAIALIPALLILSICIALWLGANEEEEKSKPVEGEITLPEMSDYLEKLNERIGERNFVTEEGRLGLLQVSAMIQGNLGPENMGYEVGVSQNDSMQGRLWKTLWITAGEGDDEDVILIAVPYSGSGTPVGFAFGFAEYLTSHPVKATVRIVFYPPLINEDSGLEKWLWERAGGEGERLQKLIRIEGDGPDPNTELLASITSTGGEMSLLSELVAKREWDGKVMLEGTEAEHLIISLGERGSTSRNRHSARLIQMMPFMRKLVQELAE